MNNNQLQDRLLNCEINQELLMNCLSYNPDTGVFAWIEKRAGRGKSKNPGFIEKSTGYHRICINGKKYYAHRLAFMYMTGQWPKNLVDHKDRNRTNNAWGNLRDCDNSLNVRNAKLNRRNKSGYKGVTFYKPTQKWMACIAIEGKSKYLGYYATPEEASIAYEKEYQRIYND